MYAVGTGSALDQTAPRCGVPAGFTVDAAQGQLTPALWDYDNTLVRTSTGCSFAATSCPGGQVAIGFKYSLVQALPSSASSTEGVSDELNYCESGPVSSLQLVCAPITFTDPAGSQRTCTNSDCSEPIGSPASAVSESECAGRCKSTS